MLKDLPYSKQVFELATQMDKIFGLDFANVQQLEAENTAEKTEIPNEVLQLAEQRVLAKKAKDFALADSLRAKIDELGYRVVDTREGYEIKQK